MMLQSMGHLVQSAGLTKDSALPRDTFSQLHTADGSDLGDSSQPYLVVFFIVFTGAAAVCAVNTVIRRRAAIATRTRNRYGSRA